MSNGWSKVPVCVAVMVMSVATIVRAEDPDTSTPKKAAVAFAKAVAAGDMTAAKSLATGTDAEFALVKSISDMAVAMKQLEDAAVKKFGPEAKLPPEMAMDLVGGMESAEEKIDGDTATLILKSKPDDKFPPTLKKNGNNWKIELSNLGKDPQSAAMAPMMPAIVKALGTVTKNIGDDKYKTVAEAYTDLGQQMAAALTPPASSSIEPAAK